jgi:hypothetical protein
MIYETHVGNSQSRDIHGTHSSPAVLNKIARKKGGTKEQQMKNLPGRKLFIRVPKKSKIKKRRLLELLELQNYIVVHLQNICNRSRR